MIRRALIALGLTAGALMSTSPADANGAAPAPGSELAPQPERASSDTPTTADQLIRDPRWLDPSVLAGLPLDGELLGSAGTALLELRDAVEEQRSRLSWAESEQTLRASTVRSAERDEDRERSQLKAATIELESRRSELLTMSVDAFVNGTDEPDLSSLLQASTDNATAQATQILRDDHLVESASDQLLNRRDVATAVRDAEQRDVDSAVERVARERDLERIAIEIRADASEQLAELEPQVVPAERRFEESLLAKTLPGDQYLSIVAVDAYTVASRRAYERWPGCGIEWHQLAGVGRVESFHGNFGSSSIDRRGQTAPHILGPQLNGDPFLAIPDTDGGLLDGDLEWDRAVGPMQFIPSSWQIFAADGNGDGTEDPHNLYDAALAAADHLCGSNLGDPGQFRRALLGYNRSVRYGADVQRFASQYRELANIPPPWEFTG